MIIRAALTAFALFAATGAAAHNFWLQPEVHTADPGEELRIDFKVGDAGTEASDWAVYWERVAAFRLYGPGGAQDLLPSIQPTSRGQQGGAAFSVSEPGSYVLAFESNPSFSDLEAERFNRYVANEGLTAIAQHRAQRGLQAESGTEIYARRAKALLNIGDTNTDNITQPIGQLLEIVPLENPFALGEGDILPLRVLWRGEPLAGATVTVQRPYREGEPLTLITNEEGEVSFELFWGSRYLISTVWGVPAPNDRRADYFTIFASMTFPSP